MKSGGHREVVVSSNSAAERSMRQVGGLPATASMIGVVMGREVGTVGASRVFITGELRPHFATAARRVGPER
jgi:hypothetical protein